MRDAYPKRTKRANAQTAVDMLCGAAILAEASGRKGLSNRLSVIALTVAGAADVARLEAFTDAASAPRQSSGVPAGGNGRTLAGE